MSSFIIQREGLLEPLRRKKNWPETDIDHSITSNAEHKNAYSSTSPSIWTSQCYSSLLSSLSCTSDLSTSQIFKHLTTLYVCHVSALKNVLYLHDKPTNTQIIIYYSSPTYKNVWQHQVVLAHIFIQLFYIDCILVIQYLDDGYRSDRNMLLKNNITWMNMPIKVHLLIYHIL